MNRLLFTLSFLIVAASLGGCATSPAPVAIAAADYGPEPVNYRAAVNEHLRYVLKDPESVRDVTIARPARGFFQYNTHSPMQFGWLTVVELNARNSFGGYAGLTPYLALIRDDKVLRFVELKYTSRETGYWGAFGQGKHFYGLADEKPQ